MRERFSKACVTGGAGFIGSHLVRALLARGLSVTVLDDLSIGRKEHLAVGAELIVGDILNPAAVDTAMAGCDIVFHLAARVAIRSSFDFAVQDTMTNVVGTANVLRGAAHAGTVQRFIGTSSMAVYADADSPAPIDEGHPVRPISPYGISKLAGEQLAHTMCAAVGIESMVLRLFNTYGPGQTFSPYVGVVTIFVNKLSAGESPVIFGDGEQCRDFVHVHDVVGGFLGAMDSPATGITVNIGTGTATSINSVFTAVQQAMGSTLAADHGPGVSGELRYSIADITKAVERIGYETKHVFQDSVREVVTEILEGKE